ncbi:BRCA1-A complex subunit Abraxas 1 isoform X2 [Vanacampus margaritifer]
MAEHTVRISGIVLTSLMFQHINKDSDVDGLLLGENHVEEHVTISDAQEDHVHLRQTCSIHKHVCCHKLNTWYDAAGKVDVAAVRRLLGANHPERVIGWYRQRRNSAQRMSMREKAVHENLKVALRVPHAIFLLLTPAALTEAGCTHRAEYAAFLSSSRSPWRSPTWRRWTIRPTGRRPRCARPQATGAPSASTGNALAWADVGGTCEFLSFPSSKLLDASGQLADVDGVNAMNESLQDELQMACGAVVDSECAVQNTLADVCTLRKKLRDSKSAFAGKEGAPAAKRNVRLQLAVRTLCAHTPLFASCTLTLDASPVLDDACNQMNLRPLPPITAGKRSAAAPPAGKWKRRKADATN